MHSLKGISRRGLLAAWAGVVIMRSARAQNILPDLGDPLSQMTVTGPEKAASARRELCSAIWGTDTPTPVGLKSSAGDVNDGQLAPSYFQRAPLQSLWHYLVLKPLPTVGAGLGLQARTWWGRFSDAPPGLVIINSSHGEGFFNAGKEPPNISMAGVDTLAAALAAKGYDIVLSSLPLMGQNLFSAPYVGEQNDPTPHDTLGTNPTFAPMQGSPLRYFLDPVCATLDYLLTRQRYARVVEIGLSGGGWITTVHAALDPRITGAYAIAGSVPSKYRLPYDLGDWEQRALPLDELDLYALSVTEAGRRGWLSYHAEDSCCFRENEVVPWASALSRRLATFPGKFSINMEMAQTLHDITPSDRAAILSEL
jgi:pimeloyl-ACP methyl ester carboxylesterase